MSVETQVRVAPNPFFALMVGLGAVVLAAGIIAGGALAVFALFAAAAFVIFCFYPVLGLYATTATLLLSGSAGVIGYVSTEAAFAVTISKLCGIAALAAWAVNILMRKLRFEFSWPVVFISAFCLWTILGVTMSEDYVYISSEWLRLITLLGYFLLAVNTLNTPRKLHTYIIVILVCGLFSAISGIVQLLMMTPYPPEIEGGISLGAVDAAYIDQESLSGAAAIRVSGRAGHSNWLSLLILLVLPMNFYWFSAAKTKTLKIFIAGLVCIEMIALILTYTRTGLLVGVVLVALLFFRRFYRVTPLRVFALLFGLVIAWMVLPAPYKERVLSPKQYTTSKSVQSRLELQGAALRYSLENPIVGLGIGGFGCSFVHENNPTAQIMQLMVDHQGWLPTFIGTHNMYLQIAADTGYVGLALFLLFIFFTMRGVHRAELRFRAEGDTQAAELASTLFVSLIGFMLCAVFLHALNQKIWWMICAAAVVLPMYSFDFKEKFPPILPISTEAPSK
ncbi:MAG TPA: O-antigen ligase family protein [Candidatus Hydrogenedentes bacterium]|mgnify:CR=1 FL=1|nr:O-antigen ligase family protein [Candidatus Hydrogenedentota bacterium]